MVSLSFSEHVDFKAPDATTSSKSFTADCDQLAIDVYYTIRDQGGTHQGAQNYASRRWHNCVDQGGSHSGSVPPVMVEQDLRLTQP